MQSLFSICEERTKHPISYSLHIFSLFKVNEPLEIPHLSQRGLNLWNNLLSKNYMKMQMFKEQKGIFLYITACRGKVTYVLLWR